MFESLSDKLSGAFKKLTGKGALSEADVRTAMREVRLALLEADVALPIVKKFIDSATAKAIGQSHFFNPYLAAINPPHSPPRVRARIPAVP